MNQFLQVLRESDLKCCLEDLPFEHERCLPPFSEGFSYEPHVFWKKQVPHSICWWIIVVSCCLYFLHICSIHLRFPLILPMIFRHTQSVGCLSSPCGVREGELRKRVDWVRGWRYRKWLGIGINHEDCWCFGTWMDYDFLYILGMMITDVDSYFSEG